MLKIFKKNFEAKLFTVMLCCFLATVVFSVNFPLVHASGITLVQSAHENAYQTLTPGLPQSHLNSGVLLLIIVFIAVVVAITLVLSRPRKHRRR